MNPTPLHPIPASETDEDTRVVGGTIASTGPDPTPKYGIVGQEELDPCLEHVPTASPADQPQSQLVLAASDLVQEQPGRTAIVRDQDIGVAIIVHVPEGGTPTHFFQLKGGASAFCDFSER